MGRIGGKPRSGEVGKTDSFTTGLPLVDASQVQRRQLRGDRDARGDAEDAPHSRDVCVRGTRRGESEKMFSATWYVAWFGSMLMQRI